MKYLALLSGAAASLGPGAGKEELDSYLYQTVGQDAIELVARALDVPLYRRVITGNAVEQGSEYGSRSSTGVNAIEGDETEDLLALLSESDHPDVLGVSVGAILSNYQRVRVEHVCRRLGLTPLCYLWNRDQGELFDEMISAGMEAILIKVAGIGLTTKHLGKTLAEMQPTLVKLNQQYGAHICGEGGEYESLTLDCPLFKNRIILCAFSLCTREGISSLTGAIRTEVETVIHSDNSFATVAFLRVKNAHLEAKPPVPSFELEIPDVLDDDFTTLHSAVEQSVSSRRAGLPAPTHLAGLKIKTADSRKLGSWVSISNIECTIQIPDVALSIEEEVTECFQSLESRLHECGLDISKCTNINVLLSDIDLFARVNAVYATFFGSSPPARACVSVDLPHPIRVRLDCVAFVESSPSDRQALHVQSLSYWAPANIGPYSQAITAGERIFISGQIGLIPAQLALPSPRSLALETALVNQHVSRVIDVLRTTSGLGWIGHTQLALYWLADIDNLLRAKSVIRASSEVSRVPNLYLVVKALPRDALIEKQVMVHTGRCTVLDEDDPDGITMQPQPPKFQKQHTNFSDGSVLAWEISHCYGEGEESAACAIICVKGGDSLLLSDAIHSTRFLPSLSRIAKRGLSVRLFYVPSRAGSYATTVQNIFGEDGSPPMTPVPCRFISTDDVDDWDYVVCIIQS
ncbi:hypothetical protein DXG01_003086 [Tephrocybe rancida]|nr:hypothetical protein DXG01_003086 [Tephrocybe rancida]